MLHATVMLSSLFSSTLLKHFMQSLTKRMITFGFAAADPGSAAELDSAVA